jgi:hypothetical protein
LFTVVFYQENMDINKLFDIYRVIILTPGLILAVLFVALVDEHYKSMLAVTIWTQLASIAFNIAIHGLVTYELNEMSRLESTDMRDSSVDVTLGIAQIDLKARERIYKMSVYRPISELAERLKYYPVVQIISLLGLTWYFLEFVMKFFPPSHEGTTDVVSWYFYCILTPSTGIGYFIVFLKVQPYAYSHLCTRLHQMFGSFAQDTQRQESAESRIYRVSSTATTRTTETELPKVARGTRIESITGSDSDSDIQNSTGTNLSSNSIDRRGINKRDMDSLYSLDEEMLFQRIRSIQTAHKGGTRSVASLDGSGITPLSAENLKTHTGESPFHHPKQTKQRSLSDNNVTTRTSIPITQQTQANDNLSTTSNPHV